MAQDYYIRRAPTIESDGSIISSKNNIPYTNEQSK